MYKATNLLNLSDATLEMMGLTREDVAATEIEVDDSHTDDTEDTEQQQGIHYYFPNGF